MSAAPRAITSDDVEAARRIARGRYGPDVRVELLSASNHVLLRVGEGPESCILKVAGGAGDRAAMRREVGILRWLRDQRIPVPRVERAELEPEQAERPFFAMSNAGSETVIDWASRSGQRPRLLFAEMGVLLARIHDLETPSSGVVLAPEEGPTEVLDEIYRFAEWLCRLGHLSPEDLDLHRSLEMPPTDGGQLCHADFHAPQCVVDGGQIVAVVDWEAAWVGNALIDLAFSHSYLDYYCMTGGGNALTRARDLRDCFFEGYATVRELPPDFSRRYLPVRMAHLLGVIRTWHGWGSEVWQEAMADRVPRATALYRAYARRAREATDRPAARGEL